MQTDLSKSFKERMGPLGQYYHFAHGKYMFPKLEGEIGSYMYFEGKKCLTWSINNYLGLANHPEVRKADAEAAAQYGLAYPMGARMMSGNTNQHEKLEKELADFVQKEDACLLNYGYQGVLSIIESLLDRRDVAVYDAECHACIIDGLRLHYGKRFVYPHNDIPKLEQQLHRAKSITDKSGGRIWVITEGVFGMSGNQGKLKEIVALKKEHDFHIFVDDAHGFGVMGTRGEGTHVEQNVVDDIDVYFSTFAKSMAGIGAFVAAPTDIINYLRYNLRSQIFAKSLPMAMVLGIQKRFDLMKNNIQFKEDVWKITLALQGGLKAESIDIGTTNAQVTPVILQGDVSEAVALTQELRDRFSIFCSLVVYPVIPRGKIILRLIPTAVHTLEDVRKTIEAICTVSEKLTNKEYAPQISDSIL